MANYQDENKCSVCFEPLNTEEEKGNGVHEGCDPLDRVSGAGLPLCGKVKRDQEEVKPCS